MKGLLFNKYMGRKKGEKNTKSVGSIYFLALLARV